MKGAGDRGNGGTRGSEGGTGRRREGHQGIKRGIGILRGHGSREKGSEEKTADGEARGSQWGGDRGFRE